MARLRIIALTVIVVAALAAAGVFAFIYSGWYSVAADRADAPAVEWMLETTRIRSIKTRAGDINAPRDLGDAVRVRRGAAGYADMCQICHLAPGMVATPLHQGLNPKAPRFDDARSHRHSPAYLFWTIKHGIKMTAMPAWGETHDDEQLWDLVAFVQQLPEMTEQEYGSLTATYPDNAGDGHDHKHEH